MARKAKQKAADGRPRARRAGHFDLPSPRILSRGLPANYLDHGCRAAVDVIVLQLHAGKGKLSAAERHELCRPFRAAVIAAHLSGNKNAIHQNQRDHGAARAEAATRAFTKLSELVDDPGFISAILAAATFVTKENDGYADEVGALARALDGVPLLAEVLADGVRSVKSVSINNPGKPWLAGFCTSLVYSWVELTYSVPAKSSKATNGTPSKRMLFWNFARAALTDLRMKDVQIDHYVRNAIKHLQPVQGVKPTLK